MKLWASLYLMVWLAALEFLLIFLIRVSDMRFSVDIHLVLGIGMLVLAQYNVMQLDKTEAPTRTKRVCKVYRGMIVGILVVGFLLYLNLPYRFDLKIPFNSFLGLIHLVLSLAVITQASSVATGYDMWEEKEFLPQSEVAPETAQPAE